jgi:outer membrane protein TolC
MKQGIKLIILFIAIQLNMQAQSSVSLTLDDALKLSRKQSLQAFLNTHNYMADYWAYRSFLADQLPSVNLQANPFNYSNASSLRYNSILQTDEFVTTENLSSDLNLNVSQKVSATGGTIFVQSLLSRIENFGDNKYTQFSSVPVSIGYRQQLFGFNNMKWDKRIEPLKFEKAKREYLKSVEEMQLSTISYFFSFVLVSIQQDIAQTNVENTRKLLEVANSRFALGTVNREELLDLRLSMNNATITLQETALQFREVKENLLNFLMLPLNIELSISIPDFLPVTEVSAQLVLDKALINNPEILQMEQNMIESRRNVEQAKKARHFMADVDLSFGLSKDDGSPALLGLPAQSGTIENVYSPDFNDQQRFSLGVTIPILDWGRSKGQYQMARSQQQVVELSEQKNRQQFEQNAVTKAIAFNILKSRVEAAALSDTLASESYELTMARFQSGQADVLRLTSSQSAKDNARLRYINTIGEYWQNYYFLRSLTLYDFEKQEDIVFNEEEIMGRQH